MKICIGTRKFVAYLAIVVGMTGVTGQKDHCVAKDNIKCNYWPKTYCNLYWDVKEKHCREKCGTCISDEETTSTTEQCSHLQGSESILICIILISSIHTKHFNKPNSDSSRHFSKARDLDGGNMIFSPTSITMALGMTMEGAKSETKNEMKQLLAKNIPDDQIVSAYTWLYNKLNPQRKEYQLYTANSVYIDDRLKLLQSYKDKVTQCFKSQAELVSFETDPEGIKKKINDWVEGKTNGKIHDLISQLERDTQMVLVNAIYFKADWLHVFSKAATTDKAFYSNGSGTPTMAKFMYQMDYFKYYKDESVQVLSLPYKGEQVTMHIFLPNNRTGLANFERNINEIQLDAFVQGARYKNVDVYMPKFKIEQELSLKRPLKTMGIQQAFMRGIADFSGMTGNRELYVSDAVHKAVIEVDEKGTEAAAATAITMAGYSAVPSKDVTFTADHPFVFGLKHHVTGQWLFLGRLVEI